MKNKGKRIHELRSWVFGWDDRILNVEEENTRLRTELTLLQAQFAAHLRDHQPTPPNTWPTPPYTFPNTWPHIISDTQSGRGLQTCVFGTQHLNPDEHKLKPADDVKVHIRTPDKAAAEVTNDVVLSISDYYIPGGRRRTHRAPRY